MRLLYSRNVNVSRLALVKATSNKAYLKKYSKKIKKANDKLIDKYLMKNENLTKHELISLRTSLTTLNSIPVSKNYKDLKESNDTSLSEEIELNNDRQDTIKEITNKQIAIIQNNVIYINNLKNNYEIDKKQYQRIINKNPNINRKEAITQTIKQTEKETPETPKENKYTDPDRISENLYRKSEIESEYSVMQNNDDVVKKIWVHVPNEHTRHESNDWQTVDINSKFEITNDKTGEMDEMEYPHDPSASYGNICNCYCELAYMDRWGNIV